MIQTMKKIITGIPIILGVVSLSIVFLSVLVQILSKYVTETPVLWTDEIAKVSFVWMVYLGAIAVFRDEDLIGLDLMTNILPHRVVEFLRLLFHVLALLVACAAFPGAVRLFISNLNYRLSFTKLPYGWLYLASSFFFIGVVIVSLSKIRLRLFSQKKEL